MGEGRREKGEGRREKGEGRREKGEGRREKGEEKQQRYANRKIYRENINSEEKRKDIKMVGKRSVYERESLLQKNHRLRNF